MTQNLDEVLKQVSKEYDLRIAPLAKSGADVEAISTGNLSIDHITGVGGLPLGRCVELFGQPGSAKTTTALMTAAQAQRDGRRVVYMDYEQKLDPKYAKSLGIDVDADTFLFVQPDNMEQGANVARKLTESGMVDVVIFDSVAAMTPTALIDKETGQKTVAEQARLMSEFLKVFVPLLRQTHTLGIFLNHEMEIIDMAGRGRPGLPPRKSTPGGRALKYFASVRMNFVVMKRVKGKYFNELTNEITETVNSMNVLVKTDKNQVGPPFREALIRCSFGHGFSDAFSALLVLQAYGVVRKTTGGVYRFPELSEAELAGLETVESKSGSPYVRGEDNLLALLEDAECLPLWTERAKSLLSSEAEPHANSEDMQKLTQGENPDFQSEVTSKVEDLLPVLK